MKNLILFCVLFSFAQVSVAFADSETLYISVRETNLRVAPEFLSGAVGRLQYGDSVTVQKDGTEWIEVQSAAGRRGYLHRSAVTTRRVVLNPDASAQALASSTDQVVLAGKGFGSDIEQQYAVGATGVNYRAVDEMQRRIVSPADAKAFILAGKLSQRK